MISITKTGAKESGSLNVVGFPTSTPWAKHYLGCVWHKNGVAYNFLSVILELGVGGGGQEGVMSYNPLEYSEHEHKESHKEILFIIKSTRHITGAWGCYFVTSAYQVTSCKFQIILKRRCNDLWVMAARPTVVNSCLYKLIWSTVLRHWPCENVPPLTNQGFSHTYISANERKVFFTPLGRGGGGNR